MPPSSPKRAQLAQVSKVASSRCNSLQEEGSGRPKWARLLFVPPFTKCTPPSIFFGNSFSVTLRNFTNFVTILIFLPQGYESLRIMYLLSFSFRRSYGNSWIAQNHLFSTSATLRNFTDRASLLPFDFRDFIYCATKDAKYLKAANQWLHVIK